MNNTKFKKVAIIEVKPNSQNYIAKEMAGGLGKKIKLGNTFLASILEYFLKDSFNAPPLILAKIAAICNQYNCEVEFYYTSSMLELENKDLYLVLASMADYKHEINFLRELKNKYPNKKIVVVGSFASVMPEYYINVSDLIDKGDPETAIQKIMEGVDKLWEDKLHIADEIDNIN